MDLEDILQEGVDRATEMSQTLNSIEHILRLRISMEAKLEEMEKRLDSISDCVQNMKKDFYPDKNTERLGLFAELKLMKDLIFGLEDKITNNITKNVEKIVEPLKIGQEKNNVAIEKIETRNNKKDAIAAWKSNIPNLLLTLLSIISIASSLLMFIKK